VIALAFTCLVLGCKRDAQDDVVLQRSNESGEPLAQDTVAPTNNVAWTAGVTHRPSNRGIGVLYGVRTARHDEYERIVLDFGADTLPGYKIEYVDRPVRQCGSGEVVPLEGDAWLMIALEPSHAHDDNGAPTIQNRDRKLNYPTLKRIKLICDFEAHVDWVAAVAFPAKYKVLELANPTRLVIDLQARTKR